MTIERKNRSSILSLAYQEAFSTLKPKINEIIAEDQCCMCKRHSHRYGPIQSDHILKDQPYSILFVSSQCGHQICESCRLNYFRSTGSLEIKRCPGEGCSFTLKKDDFKAKGATNPLVLALNLNLPNFKDVYLVTEEAFGHDKEKYNAFLCEREKLFSQYFEMRLLEQNQRKGSGRVSESEERQIKQLGAQAQQALTNLGRIYTKNTQQAINDISRYKKLIDDYEKQVRKMHEDDVQSNVSEEVQADVEETATVNLTVYGAAPTQSIVRQGREDRILQRNYLSRANTILQSIHLKRRPQKDLDYSKKSNQSLLLVVMKKVSVLLQKKQLIFHWMILILTFKLIPF